MTARIIDHRRAERRFRALQDLVEASGVRHLARGRKRRLGAGLVASHPLNISELNSEKEIERRHAGRRTIDPLPLADDRLMAVEHVLPQRLRSRDVEPTVALDE